MKSYCPPKYIKKIRPKTLSCGVFPSWPFFNLSNSAISENTLLGDLEMCIYRCECLIKETLVTVKMRTVQILYKVWFMFSLFLWQSNFRQGQEENCTEVWTQLFPTEVTTFPSFPHRIITFQFWSKQPTKYRSMSGMMYNLHYKCLVYCKNIPRTLHHGPS